ncbi:hypothetical protein ACFOET_10645 [Parapedobacter deserti]|uniref:Glycosyl-4,4'-diaponeurosporenoate acyltransferase n=1 Tax=Parapedobacter deserti TaxID=1912957 RepID=A0ABV7JLU5_9SPHI
MPKRKQIDVFSHLLNIGWSVIFFTPLLMYWMEVGIDKWLSVLIMLSIVTAFVPRQILHKLRIYKNKKSYEKWRLKTFRKFVQEGDHSWATKTRTRSISNPLKAKQYLGKIDMYERFHWCCLIFFLLSSLHCFLHDRGTYGILITVANVVFNIPTILLQQYNRLRIEGLMKRQKEHV